MSRAPEPLVTREYISIQEVYTQRWEPKTSTSAKAAGIAFIDNGVVFLVLNFPGVASRSGSVGKGSSACISNRQPYCYPLRFPTIIHGR